MSQEEIVTEVDTPEVEEETTEEVESQEETTQSVPYDRFSKEVKRRKELEEQLASFEKEKPEQLPKKEVKSQFDDLADNLSVLKPLETDEIEELRSQAKDLGVDPIKFAQSSAWKAHLDNFKSNKKAEDTTPEPSNRTAVFEGKTFADIVHSSDSAQETRQSAFEAQRDSILKRGANQNI